MKTKILNILGIILIIALVIVSVICIIRPMLKEDKKIENTDLQYKAEAIRTHLYKENIQESVVDIINNINDLNKYMDEYEDNGLHEKLSKYAQEYFTTKSLIIVTKPESSGSNTNTINRVEKINNTLNIYVERQVPDMGTADMAMWHLIIELDNEIIQDIEEITVK